MACQGRPGSVVYRQDGPAIFLHLQGRLYSWWSGHSILFSAGPDYSLFKTVRLLLRLFPLIPIYSIWLGTAPVDGHISFIPHLFQFYSIRHTGLGIRRVIFLSIPLYSLFRSLLIGIDSALFWLDWLIALNCLEIIHSGVIWIASGAGFWSCLFLLYSCWRESPVFGLWLNRRDRVGTGFIRIYSVLCGLISRT